MSQTKAQLIDPVDGTIVNADINASAAIAGTKISPDFGSQNIVTTGTAATGTLTVDGADTATGSGGPTALNLRQGDANDEFVNLSFQTGTGGPLGAISAVADATGVYPNTTGQLRFSTQVGSGLFERMFIKSDGKIGIGTASPDELLHISAASNPLIRIENTDTTLVGDQVIGGIEFEKQDSSGGGVGVVGGLKCRSGTSTGSSAYLAFSTSDTSTNNQERMRITSDGNVGIGTTSPSLPLVVEGANNTTFDHVSVLNLSGTDAYNSGNAGSGILFSGKYNSSGSVTTLAQISGIKEDTSDGTFDGALTFGVRNDAQGVDIERMRIGSNGHVGINTAGTDSTYMTHIKSTSFGLLKLETTLSDANAPYLEMKHTSTSPADNDQLGIIQFKGKNSNDDDHTYGYLMFRSIDVTDGTEDGELQVVTHNAGVSGARLTVGQDGAIKANTGNFVVGTAGRGIQFNAADSGSNEILDDYEEISFTPIVSSGVTNPSYSVQRGAAIKIGRQVFFQIDIAISGGTANSNHLKFGNLPFTSTSSANADAYGGAAINYQQAMFVKGEDVSFHVGQNDNQLKCYTHAGAAMAGNNSAVNDITSNIIFHGQYIAAS